MASKFLYVEGSDDLHFTINLMKAHGVPWSSVKKEWPVHVEACEDTKGNVSGIDRMLDENYIPTRLKQSDGFQIGILVDADKDADARWQSIRNRCMAAFPNLPETIPLDGVLVNNNRGSRLGVWIMPNNKAPGTLETFLKPLAFHQQSLLEWAVAATEIAKLEKGAEFTEVHKEKAEIRTFLAWQEDPGKPIGLGVLAKYFKAHTAASEPFVHWFKTLFDLNLAITAPS